MSDRIVDWVFLVVTAAQADGGVEIRLQGTGFLLAGGDGLAITARHVARALGEEPAGGMFRDDDDGWRLTSATEVETHPREDVAWLRLETDDHGSQLRLDPGERHQATPYMVWGYPEDVHYEMVDHSSGKALPRPDLIYSEGYVRRRMTGIPIDSVSGHTLFELSAVAGDGCSGGPVIWKRPGLPGPWQVIGVYIGQRTNYLADDPNRRRSTADVAVGYATRVAGDDWFTELMP